MPAAGRAVRGYRAGAVGAAVGGAGIPQGQGSDPADVAVRPESLARPDRYGIHDRTRRQSGPRQSVTPSVRTAPAADAASRSLAVVAGARLGDVAQNLGIQHDDGAMLQTHPVATGPGTQLLVDALSRHADHLADLLLGDRDGPALRCGRVLFGQPDQRTGQPPRQVLQD